MKTHQLKTHPEYFNEVWCGNKSFEIRKNDRDFKVGDDLELQEFNPKTNTFTGRRIHARIGYIFSDSNFGIQDGFSVLSMKYIKILPTLKNI